MEIKVKNLRDEDLSLPWPLNGKVKAKKSKKFEMPDSGVLAYAVMSLVMVMQENGVVFEIKRGGKNVEVVHVDGVPSFRERSGG